MKEYLKKNKRLIVTSVFIIIPVAAFYLTFGCPIRFFTGISCPGCGMSRALKACLLLDFEKAFNMHPLIFIMPLVAVIFLIKKHIPKKMITALTVLFFILMLITYFIRLYGNSEVVYFAPQTGAIYKLFNFLGGILNGKN